MYNFIKDLSNNSLASFEFMYDDIRKNWSQRRSHGYSVNLFADFKVETEPSFLHKYQ